MTRWSLFLQTLSLLHHFLGLYSDATGEDPGVDADFRVGVAGLTNPSEVSGPTTFFVRITTYSDTGLTSAVDGPSQVASAVIPVVSVSATQDAILTLTVSGVNSGVNVDTNKGTTATSTATTLPFGTFLPLNAAGATSTVLAHTINVQTNGATGYIASVQGGSTVAMSRTGGGADISFVATETVWNEASTEGMGVSASGADAAADFDDNPADGTLEDEPISSATAALTLASDSAPTNGVDTTVIYWAQVDVIQAAGEYSGTINYTVLPNPKSTEGMTMQQRNGR